MSERQPSYGGTKEADRLAVYARGDCPHDGDLVETWTMGVVEPAYFCMTCSQPVEPPEDKR